MCIYNYIRTYSLTSSSLESGNRKESNIFTMTFQAAEAAEAAVAAVGVPVVAVLAAAAVGACPPCQGCRPCQPTCPVNLAADGGE